MEGIRLAPGASKLLGQGTTEVTLFDVSVNYSQLIYAAKGANRSWKWLAMITVCIFILRDTMRTVQKAYNIPVYGTSHSIPDMTEEINRLASALKTERVQQHTTERKANNSAKQVRDLFGEGSKYPDSKGAFAKFKRSQARPVNVGVTDTVALPGDQLGEDASDGEEEYVPDEEDIGFDDEEPYTLAAGMIRVASQMVDEAWPELSKYP
jgi:hypothetical protein